MNAATSAAIAAMMSAIGFAAIAANRPERAPLTAAIPVFSCAPNCMMLPIPLAMLPIVIRTGATAAAMSAMVAITFFVPSSRLFSLFTKSCTC